MSGQGDPPEGRRGGGPDGEDEFRVVFDESFVRAAVLHEPSAQERMRTGRGPRRLRRVFGVPIATIRVGVLLLSVVLVLAGALYLGARRGAAPNARAGYGPTVLVRVSLVPADGVHVGSGPMGADPFAGSAAAEWRDGRAGIVVPDVSGTRNFSAAQIRASMEMVRDFVTGTQLDTEVWRGVRPWAAAVGLDPDQHRQLIDALDHPADDDVHSATGWVTRFDPAQIVVADTRVRVQGGTSAVEAATGELLVGVDGVFVYAVHQVDTQVWTRFVVHRSWEFEVTEDGLRHGRLRVRRIVTVAAPQSCAVDSSAFFRPVFGDPAQAGVTQSPAAPGASSAPSASGAPGQGVPPLPTSPLLAVPGATPPGADPLRPGMATGTLCGVLAVSV
ncbi:hypothetical protein [Yinghuangia seranimata]|uniref:SCO2583 family membrane protein n=1 Tax=Yinghuangia seranimata TaxID=408067 RepID=UPI00248B0510|nr:hypothetical protein [Yinghuangia seranimata]MDI2127408.1 hypothetical protein [Yinghuangia seranimata]